MIAKRLTLLAGLLLVQHASAIAAATPVIHVTIRDHSFIPKVVHARVGQTIVWSNADQDPHTVTSGTTNVGDGRWKSSAPLAGGDTFALRLQRPGTYPYFCKPHQFEASMHGTIVVTR
jgi:plastocyanin